MTIKKEISVKTGSYVGNDGKERGRYVTIGHIHDGQHGEYVTLEAHINLAAFPRKEGDSRVIANLYDPKPRDGAPKAAARSESTLADDVPW